MHELSITSEILDVVLSELAAEDYNKIIRIDITIGDFSGIVSENVNYYFRLLSRDTPAAGAALTFTYKKSKFRCISCGRTYERCNFSILCPVCNGRGTLVESCTSIYISRIEVE
ncbi:MAG: hydrogenase maturation nickel metallochaperone HypA [Thermoanaerobacteraceae bacterium]|nr:hydrogenase maturation nickel metallochaperone HypA [Thermoanaerobacteraceae bacterium]